MKKISSLILAAVMTLSMAVLVFAEDITKTGTAEMKVTANVEGGFTVTIPDEITLTDKEDGTYEGVQTLTVTKTGAGFGSGKNLVITVGSNNGFQLSTENGDLVGYKIHVTTLYKVNKEIASGGDNEVLSFDNSSWGDDDTDAGGEAGDDVVMVKLTVTSEKIYNAGEYSDTLTFTVEIQDQ